MKDRRSRPQAWTAALVAATLGHAALAAADSLSDQVRQRLATTGTVDALAATALREPSRDAETLLGQARLAVEAGNLDAALPLWKALADGSSRANPAVWGEVANLSELLGRDDAAEQAWRAVIDCAPTGGDVANDARLRLAMLRLEVGRPAEARASLDAVAASPGGAARAGLVAALYGRDDAAARYFSVSPHPTVGLQLLAGNSALRAGQLALARQGFEWAANHAADARDQRYATERLLAVAAKDGTLDALATRWLADPDLKPERCLPLAIVLRQAGRDAELLNWWRRDVGAGPRREVLLSDRFVAEVAAAALSAGGAGGVRGICQELVGREAQRETSVPVAARLLLSSGDGPGADALLDREADGAAGDAVRLEGLGKVARSLGRDDVAHRVADRLAAIGGAAAIRGLLLDGSVSLRADDHDRAAGALRRAAKLAIDHPELGADVAAELDGAGLDDEAIALLRATAADDDGLLQLSGLLVERQRAPEAMAVLNRLRRTTKSPGAAAQAGQRMLEIAGATDGFEGLAATLRSTLDGGGGTAGDVSLLADVYLSMHHSEAAVTLLESTPLLDPPTRLRRLSTLFLRMREYGRADEVLRQIAASEPANAVATLEQIAWVATERKRGDDATAAIGEIAARVGTGPTADELMGGIYDRLGWPGEAATRYRRAIAAGGSPEDWLLWSTAVTKAGQPDVAGQRLQMLCGDSPSDAVFAVAVDGLLDVDTPVPALRAARRSAVLRAARSPGAAMLVHLVRDLSDELGDAAFGRRVSETAVAFATDERPQLLRELAAQAAAAGDVDGAIAAGTSILASGDDFPPQVFLDLGEQLLVAGRPGDAARALGRAADGPSGDTVLPRVAACTRATDITPRPRRRWRRSWNVTRTTCR